MSASASPVSRSERQSLKARYAGFAVTSAIGEAKTSSQQTKRMPLRDGSRNRRKRGRWRGGAIGTAPLNGLTKPSIGRGGGRHDRLVQESVELAFGVRGIGGANE